MDTSDGTSRSAAPSVPELLCNLGMVLNCKRSESDFCMDYGQSEETVKVHPTDFRELFRRLYALDDALLLEQHYKLFLHLYRLMLKVEPDETKCQEYLLLCYHLFDGEESARKQRENSILYSEQLSDSLLSLAKKMIQLNEIMAARSTENKACEIASAPVERALARDLRGLRRGGAGSKTISMLERTQLRNAESQNTSNSRAIKNSTEPKGHTKYSFRTATSSENLKKAEEAACQLLALSKSLEKCKCQLQRLKESAELGYQFTTADRRSMVNMAQQTDISCVMADQSVQTRSSCSDLSLPSSLELIENFKYNDLSELTPRISSSKDLQVPLGARGHILLSHSEETLGNSIYPSIDQMTVFPDNQPDPNGCDPDDRIASTSESRIFLDMPNESEDMSGQGYNALALPALEHEHNEWMVEGLRPQRKLSAKPMEPIIAPLQQVQGSGDRSVISEARSTQYDVSDLLIDNQSEGVSDRTISVEKCLRVLQQTMEMLSKMQVPTELRRADTPISPPISITPDNNQLQANLNDADRMANTEAGKAGTPSILDDKSIPIEPIIQQSPPPEVSITIFSQYIAQVLQQSVDEAEGGSSTIPQSQLQSSLEKAKSIELDSAEQSEADETIRPQSTPLATRSEPTSQTGSLKAESPSSGISKDGSGESPLNVVYDCQSVPVKWEHRRYLIYASDFIIKQFKCNPAYQWSLLRKDGTDFYEQWCQLEEIAASCPNSQLDVHHLMMHLTDDELLQYEALRRQLCDPGQAIPLTSEQRVENAVDALLGHESELLCFSGLEPRLMLRSPHHRESVSESYILLALAEVGYYYRCLQQTEKELLQLGDYARALAPCLQAELAKYSDFCQRLKMPSTRLICLFQETRRYLHRFRWMLELFSSLCQRPSLLQKLQQQIGLGDAETDKLVKQWLQCAAEPFMDKLSRWLLLAELPTDEFFIKQRKGNSVENYWQHEFELVPAEVPHFISMRSAELLLIAGKNSHYARVHLDLKLKQPMWRADLQRRLSVACAYSYEQMDEQPLKYLVDYVQLFLSMQLFKHLKDLVPRPIQLFGQLHKYLMLGDLKFTRELIELLEPALEQPAEYFNATLLNSMLEPLQNDQNEGMYVERGSGQGSSCWSCFVLRWRHVPHWLPLIGGSQSLYESCFTSLWQLHYADYVLNERINRQHLHIWDRVSLEHSPDVRMVRDRFDDIIDRLRTFILELRTFIVEDILANEYEDLYFGSKTVDSLHELLELHGVYLKNIQCGLWLTDDDWASRLRLLLSNLYDPIFQLDEVQQNFLSLCQFYKRNTMKHLPRELRWSCQNTQDSINYLDWKFQKALRAFLAALRDTGKNQLILLAHTLAG